MNSKLLSIIAVLIGILLPMKVSAQMGDYISAPEFTFEGDNIVMTCETQGANIYYVMSEFANEEEAYSLSEALDVSEANSMRTLYTQPFPVTSNVVIKAVAKMPQQQGESEVTTLIYSYTAWSGLLSAIEYGSKVQERAKDSPLVSDDLKEQLQWALEEGQMIYGYRGQMPDSHEAEHFAEEILQIAHEIEEILNQQPAIAEVMLTGKNANYWYDETGTDPNGDEAVVFTLPENPDGGNLWEINVLTAFIRNQLAFTTPEGEAVDNITGEFRFESEGNMVALNDGKMLMYESADEQGEIAMIEPGMGMMRIINNEITQRLLNEPNSQFMALPVNVMAYQDGKEVPVINGRFTVLVRLEKQQKEPEPYAVLSQNNTVLTFYYDTNKERMNGMSVGPFSNPESRGWHDYREIITTVVFDATFANCTTLTRTAYWFRDCKNLTTIIGISNLKTDHVTNMNSMFEWCTSLTNLDVSGFKTDNVTSMQGLFWYCSSLTSLDVSNFNTDNVTNMYGVFTGCSSLVNIDVSHFNTDNVTDMCSLFDGCSSLKSVELSNFNTAKVWRTFGMFRNCTSLTSLDLSSFNMESVEDMGDMFRNCSNLKTIYVSNEWITSNVTKSSYMFEDCTSLVGGAGTHYHADHIDHTYARIDGGPNSQTPGYFTRSGDEPWVDPVEPEPYAVLSQNNTVMTFYYDDQMEERGGISLEDDRWEGRERELSSSIVALVFDDSFSDYVVNEVEDFIINLDGWTSLAAVRAGNVRIPTDEYAKVGNPNLLVYVNEPSLAPQGVQNVVVNGLAREIVLTNATEGNNNWHCPEPFRAERISYTRNFRQQTEVGISRGWESIALPFTVQTITHETQGQIIPFGAQGTGKYFWLRGYSPEGLHRATVLEANTPYVISMPNNPTVYPAQYNLNGRVTFSAENTTVPATPEFEEMLITRGNITMAPIFVVVPQDEAVYAINVSQPLDRYAEGSVFTRELREVRPFEAATTHEPVNGARPKYIRIAAQPDDDITGIRTIELDETEGTWYSLDGRQMQGQPQRKGVYLQKGKKIVVK